MGLDLNEMARIVHETATEKGWHEPPVGVGTFVANLHGEVSELWEAYRSGTLGAPCGKAGVGLTCLEEELADILIRTLDMADTLGVDIARAVATKHAYNRTRSHRHGGKVA